MCVTDENGIPKNSTVVVGVVFANTLGAQRPACLP
jgi:hypothetical protein